MELRSFSKHIAGLCRAFMTVLILLCVFTVLQATAIETVRMFTYAKRPTETKSEPQRSDEEKRIERIARSSKEFLPDGTIHLVDGPWFQPGRFTEPKNVQIYDTNDNLLWDGPSDKKPYEYLTWAEHPRANSEAFEVLQMRRMQMFTPAFSRTIEVPIGSLNNTEHIWRYRPSADRFEGFAIGGGRIGYIGAAGFTDSKSNAKPFGEFRLFTAWTPRDSSSPTLLWQTNKRVYQINFEKKQTELLFQSTDSEIETMYLHAWKDLRPGTAGYIDTETYRPLLVCVTKDGMHHLILREPDQRLSFGGPRSWVTATRESIYALRNSVNALASPPIGASEAVLKEWFEQYRKKPQKRWVELYKVSNDGGLKLVNRYDWTAPGPGRYTQMETTTATQRFVTHFSPPLYNLALRVTGGEFWLRVRQSANRGDFLSAMLQTPLYHRPLNNTANLMLSALMVGFVLWYGLPRRTSNARFAFWLVFVGLLNVTGLLTYLTLNYTAAIKCPVCGRRRGLTQPDCARCQAPLPAPKPRDLDLILTNP